MDAADAQYPQRRLLTRMAADEMSYGSFARKVCDPSLAYGQRVNALAGCIVRYRPIGFHATFAYLEHVAGKFRRDDDALLAAMATLSSSRDLWLVELGAYAKRRREAKRQGWRTPRPSEPDPSHPMVWYGDSRNAAMFAIGFVLRRRDGRRPGRPRVADAKVVDLASTVLERGGRLQRSELEQARLLRLRFEELRHASGWPNIDWPNWHKANDSLWILHLIESVEGTTHPSSETALG
jgi:hypothetical protein